MGFNIEYRLTGCGWFECTLTVDGEETTVSASYLGDALGDLAQAVLAVCSGAEASSCLFWEEPGEFRWSFRSSGGFVLIEIDWFDDWEQFRTDHQGKQVFCAEVGLDELREQLADAMQRVLDEWGEDGYLEQWAQAPFPTRAFLALRG